MAISSPQSWEFLPLEVSGTTSQGRRGPGGDPQGDMSLGHPPADQFLLPEAQGDALF